MLGLDELEIDYLVSIMILLSHCHGRKKIIGSAVFALMGLALVVPGEVSGATAPVFGDMRGTYRGVERIVIKKSGKPKRLSAPVKVVIRLSRGKKALQISTEGTFIRNNKREKITSNYSLAGKGRAVLRLRDKLTPSSLRAQGTGNLRRMGGRFTMIGRGYGLKGVVTGQLRMRGNSLRIQQTLRDGTQEVTFRMTLSRRAK